METIFREDIKCSICGSNEFIKCFADDGCYVCKNYVGDERKHETPVAYYCRGCKKEYPRSRFGENNGIFICKECDRTQWGITEFFRDKTYWITKNLHPMIRS